MLKLLKTDAISLLETLTKVDMVLVDPPFGTTKCTWDLPIPMSAMWSHLTRICNGPIIFFATQPFTSQLVLNNLDDFKYTLVWDKVIPRGHLTAKKRPMAQHEDIVVFYEQFIKYNPQRTRRSVDVLGREGRRSEIMGGESTKFENIYTHKNPTTILRYQPDKNLGHPTQKPVSLCQYLIETYSNPGDLVLDFAFGTGTTAKACMNSNRGFVGCETSEEYFEIACRRFGEIPNGHTEVIIDEM